MYVFKMDLDFVDVFIEFGIFLEEDKDIIQVDYLYIRVLIILFYYEKVLVSCDWMFLFVEEIDQRYFSIIDSKVKKIMFIFKGNLVLCRVMEEIYYYYIYYIVVIEGNIFIFLEIRYILEICYVVVWEEFGGVE